MPRYNEVTTSLSHVKELMLAAVQVTNFAYLMQVYYLLAGVLVLLLLFIIVWFN